MLTLFGSSDINLSAAITIISFSSPLLVWLTTWLYQYVIEHQPSARAKRMHTIVTDVVTGVEQLGYAFSATNAQKKAKAMNWVLQIAHSYHLPINDAEIEALVEAAVARLPATWEHDPNSAVAKDNWTRDTSPTMIVPTIKSPASPAAAAPVVTPRVATNAPPAVAPGGSIPPPPPPPPANPAPIIPAPPFASPRKPPVAGGNPFQQS